MRLLKKQHRKVEKLKTALPALVLGLSLLCMTPFISAAQIDTDEPEKKGIAIAAENDRRDSGWLNNSATVKMILTNKHGQTNTRMIRFRTMETIKDGVQVGGDKTLLVFDSPLDIKGTAFLTHSHKDRDDDQWLYLPTLKRVKRISARNKSGSFVGSEFAYEDISSEEVEKYTYQWLRDEVYDGRDCYVVERVPVDKKNTGYKRHIVWFDKAEFLIRKIDYYDRKDMLLKTLTFKNYEKQLDTFWRARQMRMVNYQNGKSTELFWSDRKFRAGLKSRDFTKNSLKRSR